MLLLPTGKTALALAVLAGLTAGLSAQVQIQPVQPVKPEPKVSGEATHKQVAEISVRSADGKLGLQTLCVDANGAVLGLVAPPRYFNAPEKDASSEVHVIVDGKTVKKWTVKFHAHSITVSSKGEVFVAGDGKVARFDREGKALGEITLPHIAEALKDTGELRKQAEAQIKQMKASFENVVKQYRERKAKIEEKKEADRTPQEKRMLDQYDRILKSYEQSARYYDNLKPDTIVAQMTARLRIINGIAVSDKDLFIVCGESKGYGFAVWRMTHDFKDSKQVLSGISGCCGQMDIQVHGEDLLVAENTKHRFARYDRDGKEKSGHGKRGRESDGECFGGCCNPMNLRVFGGDIYTAESEGIVKRFSARGEYLGLVGTVKIQGGCKNVAIGVSPRGDRVYFCDQPGSKIIVLEKKKAATTAQ